MKTLGWEGVDLRKARKFGSNRRGGAGAASQLCFCGLAGGSCGTGIAPELLGFSSPLKIPIRLEVFGINPCAIHLGCVCFGCSGARFVTLCVFSPLSPLLPAPLQVPSSPRYLRIRQPNLEIINLEWDHPEHPNGVITGYTLRYQPCTSHVLLSVINQGILPFLLFPRAGRSMRNWRLPWWDKPVLGGVLDICSGGGGCSAAPQNQILRENQLDLGFRKILGAA